MKVIYLASKIYHLEDLLQEKIHRSPNLHLARLKGSALTSRHLRTPCKVLIESKHLNISSILLFDKMVILEHFVK